MNHKHSYVILIGQKIWSRGLRLLIFQCRECRQLCEAPTKFFAFPIEKQLEVIRNDRR